MNQHIHDSCIVTISTLATAAATLTLSAADSPTAQTAELQLFLLTFIGAVFTSGGLIMLNPEPETRRIVIGRSIFALFFGVLVPQIIGMFHPSLAALSIKPVVLVLMGGLCAALAYVLSRPFAAQAYGRAAVVAERELNRIEGKYSPPVKPPSTPPES